MKLRSTLMVLAIGLFGACASVMAETAATAVSVADPYARAMPPGQPTSLAFMALTNKSGQAHALVAAESGIAKKVELHTHTMKDGMMHMHRVEKIDLPAGATVKLQSGGLHVMLMGLKQDLKAGENIAITLVFEDGSKTELKVPVRKVQMKIKKMDMQHNMH